MNNGKLTIKERKYIIDNMKNMTVREIADELETHYDKVYKVVHRQKIKEGIPFTKSNMVARLNDKEEKYINENAGEMTIGDLAEMLGVREGVIYSYCKNNNIEYIREKEKFTEEETDIILNNYGKISNREIAKKLNIAKKRLDRKIEYLIEKGVLKREEKIQDRNKFSEKENSFIKENIDKYTLIELSEIMGIEYKTLRNYCYRNDIRKSS